MKTVIGALKATFQVPQNRMAELIATTLPQCSWRVSIFNEEAKTCTAERRIDMGSGNPNSVYNYTANIEWKVGKENKDKYRLRIEISEAQNKASQYECEALCNDFLERVERNSIRFQKDLVKERTTFGSARWAELKDLEAVNYVIPNKGFDPKSFIVGPYADETVIAIPPKQACTHSVVCGSTGTGKTSGFIVPQAIMRLDASAIFTEATDGSTAPHVYSQTARWRHEQGKQDIYYFNPDDLTSNQINLITTIKRAEDAATIASLIINNTSHSANSGGDPFWEQAETYLLNALLLHLAGCRGTLAHARVLVQQGPTALAEQLQKSYYQKARDEFAGFLNTGTENTRSNVFIGLLQRLAPFSLPIVQKLTETTDFDIKGLRDRLFSFYLAVPAEKTTIQPVASLILSYLLDVVVEAENEEAEPMKHPLMLVLDEFTNFGRISNFQKKLSIIRHREIGVTMGFQFMKQIVEVYGQNSAEIIMSQPGTRIFLRPRDMQTAESISKQLGNKTHYERKVTSSGAIVEKEIPVNLMPAADILALPFGEAILFTPDTKPMKIKPFSWKDTQYATSLAPWKRRKLEVQRTLVAADDVANLVQSPEQITRRSEHDRLNDEVAPEF